MSIGFGVVGTGMMGRIYVRALRQMVDGADVVAVQGGSRAAELAAEVDVPVEPTLDALLARPDVDAILLASPTQTHLQQTLAAAAAGKHVFTEKPIAATLPEIDQMVAATRAAGVLLGREHRHALSDRLPDGEAAHRRGRDRRAAHGPPHLRPHRLGLSAPSTGSTGPRPGARGSIRARTASTPSAGSWATRSTPCTPATTTTRRTPRPTRAR